MPLTDRVWRELLVLSGELAELSETDADDGIDRLMASLYRLTGADEGFILFTTRTTRPGAADPLGGWRPARLIYNRRSEERARIATEWASDPRRLVAKQNARRIAAGAGTTRVTLRSDLAASPPRHGVPVDAPLFAELGVRDRLTGGTPVDPATEVVIGLDVRRRTTFSDDAAEVTGTALTHLRWFFRRLAGHMGIAAPRGPRLSPREREALRLLLGGGTEKTLAREMGVAASTFHQYVKALYRKLGVSSRAALMARFVGRAASAEPLHRERGVEPEGGAAPRLGIVTL